MAGGTMFSRLQTTTLCLLAMFVVLVLVFGAYHLQQQYDEAVESATRSARNVVRTVESHAERTFGETFRVLEGIADFYRSRQGSDRQDGYELHRLLATKLAQMPHVSELYVLDSDRRVISSARAFPISPDQKPLPMGDSASVPLREIDPGQYIGRLFQAPADQAGSDSAAWILPIGTVILDLDGAVVGLAVAMIDPTSFNRFYDSVDIGTTGVIDLWSADGSLVASSKNSTDTFGAVRPEVVSYFSTYNQAFEGATELTYAIPDGYSQRIQASGWISSLDLAPIVVLRAEDYLMPWRQSRNRIGIAMTLIIASTIAGAVFILRQLKNAQTNEQALRQAKVAAEEASDAKSKFLAHMSHEFRTPLNAIMGFSEIIKTKVLGEGVSPVYVSYAEHIFRSGEHLLKIVNDILDMAKIESGAQPMAREAFEVSQAMEGAVAFVEGLADQKRLHIRILLPAQLPRVNANERLTRQVFINLLSNAIKFSQAGTEIDISARWTENGPLEVMIGDRGPGIDPTILRRIGEPFLQGNPTVSRSGQGTGLGLSICKNYMNLMGGDLMINSAVGRGTTAVVRFPPFLLLPRQPPRAAAAE